MAARFVHGSTLERGDDLLANSPTYTNITQLVSVGLPVGGTVDKLESTVLSSPDFTKEYIPGLLDRPPCPYTIRFDPNEASHQTLQDASLSRTKVAWRVRIPPTAAATVGASWEWDGWSVLDNPEAGSEILDASGSIEVVSAVTYTAES